LVIALKYEVKIPDTKGRIFFRASATFVYYN